MSNRINNLYSVQVVKYAWIAVEADSPQEAMEMAREVDLDEYIEDEQFEDSEICVDACETYSTTIEGKNLDDDEYILTHDGAITAAEYEEQLEEQEG